MDEVQTAAFPREITGHQYEQLYKIALFTGLREGEVLGLTWDCIDLDKGTLLVKRQLRREQKKGGNFFVQNAPKAKEKHRNLTISMLFSGARYRTRTCDPMHVNEAEMRY